MCDWENEKWVRIKWEEMRSMRSKAILRWERAYHYELLAEHDTLESERDTNLVLAEDYRDMAMHYWEDYRSLRSGFDDGWAKRLGVGDGVWWWDDEHKAEPPLTDDRKKKIQEAAEKWLKATNAAQRAALRNIANTRAKKAR